ncbi:hypothetical protein GQ600_19271 [Phytophthora cactorum]|nr:hypothetical protein GQ600_19271 [Phytophthora cactorum]
MLAFQLTPCWLRVEPQRILLGNTHYRGYPNVKKSPALMCPNFSVLLATAALLAIAAATLTSAEAQRIQVGAPAYRKILESTTDSGLWRRESIHASWGGDYGKSRWIDGFEDCTNLNIQTWLLKGASIDDIFTQLSLKTAGSKIFEDPKFMTWVVYVTKAEKQNAGDVILAKLMTQYTPDSLAAMIAAAKKVSSTESLARVLQAQQRQSPQFTTWASYVDEFNRNIPNKAVSMLTLLAKHYDDVDLGKMLEAAKKVPSTESIAAKLQSELKASLLQEGKKFTQTKKIAEDLQSAQFARWFYDGKTMEDLLSILKLKKATWRGDPNAVIIHEYMKFYNAMMRRTYR